MKNFAEKRKFLDQSLEIMQTVLSIQKFTLTLNGLHGVKKREFYSTANIMFTWTDANPKISKAHPKNLLCQVHLELGVYDRVDNF